jgi:hypothetical protein
MKGLFILFIASIISFSFAKSETDYADYFSKRYQASHDPVDKYRVALAMYRQKTAQSLCKFTQADNKSYNECLKASNPADLRSNSLLRLCDFSNISKTNCVKQANKSEKDIAESKKSLNFHDDECMDSPSNENPLSDIKDIANFMNPKREAYLKSAESLYLKSKSINP